MVLGWEPEWSVLSGLPFFSVRRGLRIVALPGSADPTSAVLCLFRYSQRPKRGVQIFHIKSQANDLSL